MKTKTLLKYVVEFIMSVTLFLFVSLLIFKTTLFNESYFVRKLDDNNYFEMLYENINKKMSRYIVQSGLPREVLKDIYTTTDLKNDVKTAIGSMYGREKIEIDTTKLKQKLELNIENYLKTNNIEVASRDSLDLFVSKMMEVYIEEIKLSNIIDSMQPTFSKFYNLIDWCLIISSVLVIVSLLYLILVSKRGRLSVAITTTGILLLICYFFFSSNIDVGNIVFYNVAVSNIIRTIFLAILKIFKYSGISAILLGIITCAIREAKQYYLK